MLFALAVLLIQPQAGAQMAYSAENTALIQPANASPDSSYAYPEIELPLTPISSSMSIQPANTSPDSSYFSPENALPLTPVSSGITIQPALISESENLPNAPEPDPVSVPAPIAFLRSSKPMTVSVAQLQAEVRHNQRIWMGLGIASHSAATFDAWSTRRAITTAGGQELNPLLKPFAGNASLYVAIQVGPLAMDYVARKMMYSRHNWIRRMWWVPQSASFASSMFCGAHNLGVH